MGNPLPALRSHILVLPSPVPDTNLFQTEETPLDSQKKEKNQEDTKELRSSSSWYQVSASGGGGWKHLG